MKKGVVNEKRAEKVTGRGGSGKSIGGNGIGGNSIGGIDGRRLLAIEGLQQREQEW
jgi:hypothetical protein